MDNYTDFQTDIYKTTSKALRMLTSYANANASHRRTAIRKQRTEAFEENKESFMDSMLKSTILADKKDQEKEDFISSYVIDYEKTDVRLKKMYSSGIQVVIINDYNNSFYPVLSINLSSFQYKMQDELDKKVGETILKGMVSYYNAQAGEWEPFIEKAKIHYLSDSYKDQNFILISFKNDLNINITNQLTQTLIQTYMSLQEKEKEEQKSQTSSSKDLIRQSGVFGDNSNYNINSSFKMTQIQPQSTDIQKKSANFEYKVTPYSIRNYSSKIITIRSVFREQANKNSNSAIPKEYVIMPGESVDYEVDYEEEAKSLMRITRDELVRKTDFLNVIFNNGESILKNVNLRDQNYYHHRFNIHNKDDYVGYGVNFENMRKIFIIRAPYVINNNTDNEYQIKILYEDGVKVQKIIDFKPGQCYPIDYKDMDKRFSICCTSSSEEWSNSIKFRTIIEKVPKDTTTYLYHGKQFSIITKEKSEFKKNYNINIKSPVLIINALPFGLTIKTDLIKAFVPKEKRQSLKTPGQNNEEDNYEYESKDFYIGKGTSLQLYNFSLKSLIHFIFTVENDSQNQGFDLPLQTRSFQWAEFSIRNTEFRDTKVFIIKDADNPLSTLEICCKMKPSQKAGVQITFYVPNIIINNTDQRLLIYYDKKLPAAGQLSASDNSIIMLSNVNSFHQSLQRQKVIACIETPDLKKSFSNPFVIDVAAVTNTIQIQRQQYSYYEFTVKTELSLASKIKIFQILSALEDDVYTKVTTISPQYVLFNKTRKTILIKQEDSFEECQIILSGQRVPFFWTDIRKNKNVQFKCVEIENAEFDDQSHDWSFKFTLDEVGRISLFNRNVIDFSQSKYILVEKELQEQNQILFITFSQENPKYPTYKIENNSRFLQVQYYQKDLPHHSDSLGPKQSKIFSWTNPQQDQLITCKFYLYNPKVFNEKAEHLRFDFQPDDLELNQGIEIPRSFSIKGQQFFYVYLTTNGYSKILTISDISQSQVLKKRKEEEIKQRDEIPKRTVNIQLVSVGLSLIVKTYQNIRKEFAFSYFENIKFIIIETEEKRELQLKIAYAQVDNNIGQKLIFPVLMYPKDLFKKRDKIKKAVKEKKGSPQEEIKDFFNSHIVIKKEIPEVMFIEQIEFLVQTIVLQLDDELIGYIYKFVSNITDSLHTNLTGIHEVFKPYSHIGYGDDWKNPDENMGDNKFFKGNDMFQILESREESEQSPSIKSKKESQEEIKSNYSLNRNDVPERSNRSNTIKVFKRNNSLRQSTLKSPKKASRQTDIHFFDQTSGFRETGVTQGNFFSQISGKSWINYNIESKGKKLYIKEYKSSPIDIELTFLSRVKMDIDSAEKNFSVIDKFRVFGLTLANVDKAPVRLNAVKMDNVFGTPNEIIYHLQNDYMQRMKSNLFTLVGSSNILGNPKNFVNHMGTGVQDFFYKPIEGIVKGPLEGGKGLIEGTSSLIKNTVQGTFGSASKMLSSVSKGLLFITDDMEFINKREEENMDKPKNILEGVGYGLKSTFTGIASGITGVFENPIKGAKQEGMKGFAKGTYKGVSGLIVKPLSGALDFFSKTSEGIKNTAASDDKVVSKIRTMRPFYGKQQLIKVYDDFHAYVMQHLLKINRGAYVSDHFVDAFYHATPTERNAIVLTEEHFLVVDSITKDVKFEFKSVQLVNVKKQEGNILCIYILQDDDIKKGYSLRIDDQKLMERYYKKIKTFIYHISSENY